MKAQIRGNATFKASLKVNDKFAHAVERLSALVTADIHSGGQLDFPESTKQVIYCFSVVGRPTSDGRVDIVTCDLSKAQLLPTKPKPKKKAKRASPSKRAKKKKHRVD